MTKRWRNNGKSDRFYFLEPPNHCRWWLQQWKYCSLEEKLWQTFSSFQFSRSVVFDSLWPHELQHARPPCPLPTPGVHPNPCPLNWWRHSTISSSVVPFSSCPQSFPASGSFPMSQFFHLRVAKVLELQLQHQSFLSKKFLFCLTGMSLAIRWWLFFVVVTLSAKLSWA